MGNIAQRLCEFLTLGFLGGVRRRVFDPSLTLTVAISASLILFILFETRVRRECCQFFPGGLQSSSKLNLNLFGVLFLLATDESEYKILFLELSLTQKETLNF